MSRRGGVYRGMTVNVAFVYMYQLFTQQPHPGDSIALSTLSPDSPSQHPETQDNPSLPSSRGETIRAFPSVRLELARGQRYQRLRLGNSAYNASRVWNK